MDANIKYGILILAAGNSTRMGQPKQLLAYQDSTLLLHAVDESTQLAESAVTVVTGASKGSVEEQLAGRDIRIVYNPDWETGMGSSIRAGITDFLETYSSIEAIMITVCDQPFLTRDILLSLIDGYLETDKGIIASAYEDTIGTPVLFSARYFIELMNLQGQEGAKKIIREHIDDVATKPFPRGGIDIDTQEDYRKLSSDEV